MTQGLFFFWVAGPRVAQVNSDVMTYFDCNHAMRCVQDADTSVRCAALTLQSRSALS